METATRPRRIVEVGHYRPTPFVSVHVSAAAVAVELGGDKTPNEDGAYVVRLADGVNLGLTPDQMRALGDVLHALADEVTT